MIENAAVIYARVHNRWCVTLDYQKGPRVRDPFLVHDGAGCGKNKVTADARDAARIHLALLPYWILYCHSCFHKSLRPPFAHFHPIYRYSQKRDSKQQLDAEILVWS